MAPLFSRMALAVAVTLVASLGGSTFVHARSTAMIYPIKAKGSDPLWHVKRDGRWGFMDRSGKIVIKPRFAHAGNFFGGIAVACMPARSGASAQAALADGDVRCGYIDRSGAFVIQPRFKWSHDFKDGVASVRMDDGETLINKDGEVLTTNRFESIQSFAEGLAVVTYRSPHVRASDFPKHDLYGFIDTAGRVVVNTIYTNAASFSEGLAAVKNRSGLWGFIDATGRVAIDFQFSRVSPFSGGVATVQDAKSDNWGVIDTAGRVVRPFNLSSAGEFHEGVAEASDEKGDGFIGRDGRFIFQRSIDWLDTLHEGLARFSTGDDRDGYVDASGRVRMSWRHAFTERFSEERAAVAVGKGLFGYVDPTGAWVIPQRFASAQEFVDGLALVQLGDEYCYIDRQGNVVARDVWDGESP